MSEWLVATDGYCKERICVEWYEVISTCGHPEGCNWTPVPFPVTDEASRMAAIDWLLEQGLISKNPDQKKEYGRINLPLKFGPRR